MARRNYVQTYDLKLRDGRTAKRYRAFWYDAAGVKHGRVFSIKRDAQAFIDSKTTDRGVGRLADHKAGAITLAELYDVYIQSNRDRWADNTTNMYRLAWKHVPAGMQTAAIRDITVPMVDAVLLKVGHEDADGKFIPAPGMSQKLRQLLSGMYKRAVHDGRVAVSPVQALGLKRTKKEMLAATARNRRALSIDELKRLVSVSGGRFRVLIEVLGRVGLRPSEAYGLTVGQVDTLNRTFNIDRTLRGPGTKNGAGRVVPVTGDLIDKVVEHIARYSDPSSPDAYVFPTNEDGDPINDNNWRRRGFRDAVVASGITPPKLTIYDLRHTACTNAVNGALKDPRDVGTLAAMTGHTPEMLLNTYYHVNAHNQAARAAVERLSAQWAAAPEPADADVVAIR